MDSSLPRQPLISPVCFLAFTALTQVVLSLWVTDRISITMASSILLGFVIFGLLCNAVRDVLASVEREQRAYGAARVSK
jgi:hypothetical protein